MSETHAEQRQCPTRRDGRAALFTHRVTEPECQSRQRGMFHRCFTCAYNNAWVARNGPPPGSERALETSESSPVEHERAPRDGGPLSLSPELATLRPAR